MTDRNYVLMILRQEHDRLAKQIAEDIGRQHYADASRCSDMATEILTGMMVIGASDQFDDPMVPPDEDDWLLPPGMAAELARGVAEQAAKEA